MSFLSDLFRKKTDYKAGGLILSEIPFSATLVKTPEQFVAPKKVDFRDMCIETSNQGQFPHCAGYATAGYIEVQNWKRLHYPKQVDGDVIYFEAKKIDGDNSAGTTLQSAVKSALNLNLITGKAEYIEGGRENLKFAIHEFGVCIAGFNITQDWNNVGSDGKIPCKDHRKIGGHAVLICGFDSEGIYIQNSWSSTWGLYGFCLLSWSQFDDQFMQGMIIRQAA